MVQFTRPRARPGVSAITPNPQTGLVSRLEQAVVSAPDHVFQRPYGQVLGSLQGSRYGVKEVELERGGLRSAYDDKAFVTREQLLETVRARQDDIFAEVREGSGGDNVSPTAKRMADHLQARVFDRIDAIDDGEVLTILAGNSAMADTADRELGSLIQQFRGNPTRDGEAFSAIRSRVETLRSGGSSLFPTTTNNNSLRVGNRFRIMDRAGQRRLPSRPFEIYVRAGGDQPYAGPAVAGHNLPDGTLVDVLGEDALLPDGRRAVVATQIQSDLHQSARQFGTKTPEGAREAEELFRRENAALREREDIQEEIAGFGNEATSLIRNMIIRGHTADQFVSFVRSRGSQESEARLRQAYGTVEREIELLTEVRGISERTLELNSQPFAGAPLEETSQWVNAGLASLFMRASQTGADDVLVVRGESVRIVQGNEDQVPFYDNQVGNQLRRLADEMGATFEEVEIEGREFFRVSLDNETRDLIRDNGFRTFGLSAAALGAGAAATLGGFEEADAAIPPRPRGARRMQAARERLSDPTSDLRDVSYKEGRALSFLHNRQRVVVDIHDLGDPSDLAEITFDFARNARNNNSFAPVANPPENLPGLFTSVLATVFDDAEKTGRTGYSFTAAHDGLDDIYAAAPRVASPPDGYQWVSFSTNFSALGYTLTRYAILREDVVAAADSPADALRSLLKVRSKKYPDGDVERPLEPRGVRALRLGSAVAALTAAGVATNDEAQAQVFTRPDDEDVLRPEEPVEISPPPEGLPDEAEAELAADGAHLYDYEELERRVQERRSRRQTPGLVSSDAPPRFEVDEFGGADPVGVLEAVGTLKDSAELIYANNAGDRSSWYSFEQHRADVKRLTGTELPNPIDTPFDAQVDLLVEGTPRVGILGGTVGAVEFARDRGEAVGASFIPERGFYAPLVSDTFQQFADAVSSLGVTGALMQGLAIAGEGMEEADAEEDRRQGERIAQYLKEVERLLGESPERDEVEQIGRERAFAAHERTQDVTNQYGLWGSIGLGIPGGVLASFSDPTQAGLNFVPGGQGRTLAGTVARNAITNSVIAGSVESMIQTEAQDWLVEIGAQEEADLEWARQSVLISAALGGVIGGGLSAFGHRPARPAPEANTDAATLRNIQMVERDIQLAATAVRRVDEGLDANSATASQYRQALTEAGIDWNLPADQLSDLVRLRLLGRQGRHAVETIEMRATYMDEAARQDPEIGLATAREAHDDAVARGEGVDAARQALDSADARATQARRASPEELSVPEPRTARQSAADFESNPVAAADAQAQALKAERLSALKPIDGAPPTPKRSAEDPRGAVRVEDADGNQRLISQDAVGEEYERVVREADVLRVCLTGGGGA